MIKPIPIHLSSNVTLTETKGLFTIISVLWHALAATIAKDILLHVFSAEWIEQYCRTGDITFGRTDIVSRLTAGYIDQIKHFFSRRATIPFRLAFISGLLLVALNGLGPSAMTINYALYEFPLRIKDCQSDIDRCSHRCDSRSSRPCQNDYKVGTPNKQTHLYHGRLLTPRFHPIPLSDTEATSSSITLVVPGKGQHLIGLPMTRSGLL